MVKGGGTLVAKWNIDSNKVNCKVIVFCPTNGGVSKLCKAEVLAGWLAVGFSRTGKSGLATTRWYETFRIVSLAMEFLSLFWYLAKCLEWLSGWMDGWMTNWLLDDWLAGCQFVWMTRCACERLKSFCISRYFLFLSFFFVFGGLVGFLCPAWLCCVCVWGAYESQPLISCVFSGNVTTMMMTTLLRCWVGLCVEVWLVATVSLSVCLPARV